MYNFVYGIDLESEPKTGIGRDNSTHTTREGLLYRAEMKRFKSLNFVVDFEDMELPESGFLKLGGDGKMVEYKKIEKFNTLDPQIPSENKRFKLYFLTPTIFKNGWLPAWINEKDMTGIYNGLTLKLLTACTGKSVNIGGFDMKETNPKAIKKAVPAGSVYYFEIIEGSIQEAVKVFYNKSISDEKKNEGFGICFVGKSNV